MTLHSFLNKLLLGKGDTLKTTDVIARQRKTLRRIWNSNDYRDFGLERLVRLTIVLLSFLDVGLYLRNIYKGKNRGLHRKVLTDFYVLFNCLLPFVVLVFGWYRSTIIVFITIYFAFETFMALLSMIFLSPEIPQAISHNRNLISLFLNFMQFVFFFAVLYMRWGSNELFDGDPSALKAIYLSLEMFTTVGLGDFNAEGTSDYVIMIVQMTVLLVFIYFFFALFASKFGEATFYNRKSEPKKKKAEDDKQKH